MVSRELLVLVSASSWGELLVPRFWSPKLSERGDELTAARGTFTGTETLTLWPATVYVAVMVAFPAPIGFTSP